jgi:hypothetical protein
MPLEIISSASGSCGCRTWKKYFHKSIIGSIPRKASDRVMKVLYVGLPRELGGEARGCNTGEASEGTSAVACPQRTPHTHLQGWGTQGRWQAWSSATAMNPYFTCFCRWPGIMVEGVQSCSAMAQGGREGNTFKVLEFFSYFLLFCSLLFAPLFLFQTQGRCHTPKFQIFECD